MEKYSNSRMSNYKLTIIGIFNLTVLLYYLLVSSCGYNEKSRKNYKFTYKIGKGIYAEIFSVYDQGAYGAGINSEWLTDSTNFRIFLGTYDEIEGGFQYQLSHDSLYIKQLLYNIHGNPRKYSRTYILKINELKKQRNLNNY